MFYVVIEMDKTFKINDVTGFESLKAALNTVKENIDLYDEILIEQYDDDDDPKITWFVTNETLYRVSPLEIDRSKVSY